jgi:hypothetical protein
VVSSSLLAFRQYAIPLLPFIAVFAAYGLFSLNGTLCKKLKNRMIGALSCGVLALMVLVPNVMKSGHLVGLLFETDTREVLTQLIEPITFKNYFAANYSRHSFRNKPMPSGDGAVQYVVLDSFSLDRHLYEECKLKSDVLDALRVLDRVLIVSPYTLDKEQVPFAVQSVFGPYPPDMNYRRMQGPYMEVYYFSSLGEVGFDLTADREIKVSNADDGYYKRRLLERCARPVDLPEKLKLRDRLFESRYFYGEFLPSIREILPFNLD